MTPAAGSVSSRLPEFPWDLLAPYAETARAHPDGVVDLSVGTPVDPTPDVVRGALEAASDAPGYPLTHGTQALRDAVVAWYARRGVPGVDPAAVMPTIGSKELVAWLPTLLGLGPGDTPATWSCTRRSPTRRTTWAPVSPERPRSRPTASPPWDRSGCAWSG